MKKIASRFVAFERNVVIRICNAFEFIIVVQMYNVRIHLMVSVDFLWSFSIFHLLYHHNLPDWMSWGVMWSSVDARLEFNSTVYFDMNRPHIHVATPPESWKNLHCQLPFWIGLPCKTSAGEISWKSRLYKLPAARVYFVSTCGLPALPAVEGIFLATAGIITCGSTWLHVVYFLVIWSFSI